MNQSIVPIRPRPTEPRERGPHWWPDFPMLPPVNHPPPRLHPKPPIPLMPGEEDWDDGMRHV